MITLDDLFIALDDVYPNDYIIRVLDADDNVIDGKTNRYCEVTFDLYGTFDCSDCDVLYIYNVNGKVVFEIDGKQIDFDSGGNDNKALKFYKAITGSNSLDY